MKAAKRTAPPETHAFTLVLSGVSASSEDMANALFAAGCDDALLGSRDGVVFLDFERQAPSFQDAVVSAVRDVHKTGYQVARVEPDEFVTASEIARRVRRSRESVRQQILGLRGPGGFPAPVSSLTGPSPLWRWTEVADWFSEAGGTGVIMEAKTLKNAPTIAVLNDLLDLVRRTPDFSSLLELARTLAPTKGQRRSRGARFKGAGEANAPNRAGLLPS